MKYTTLENNHSYGVFFTKHLAWCFVIPCAIKTSCIICAVHDQVFLMTSAGGLPTSDGGLPTSDGGLPTSDGGLPTSDGGLPTSDGGLQSSDSSDITVTVAVLSVFLSGLLVVVVLVAVILVLVFYRRKKTVDSVRNL